MLLVAALVSALVVVPFRPLPRGLVAAALALLVYWSRAPNPQEFGIISPHSVFLGTPSLQHAGIDGGPAPKLKFGIACWDRNADGLCDTLREDVNGDGKCDVQDCRAQTPPAPQTLTERYGIYIPAPSGATTNYAARPCGKVSEAEELTKATQKAMDEFAASVKAYSDATVAASQAALDALELTSRPRWARW